MRVGIVGAGFMGTTHAAGWAETPAQIAGITAATEAEAQPLADLYRTRMVPSYEELLSDSTVDVIDICTPTHTHYNMILQAASAGKHIVCEKPLARTAEQAQNAIAACRKAGVQLLVAHVVRFFPEYVLAKATVDQGKIGRPAIVRLSRGSYRPKRPVGNWFLDVEKSGGIMLDLMIHDFDYARWISGEVESVFARTVSTIQEGAPLDYGLAILQHVGGAISHIAGAWAYPPPTFRTKFEIAGDRGLIEFDSTMTAPLDLLLFSTGPGTAPDVAVPSSPLRESPYTTEIKEFYTVLAEGRPPRVTAEDGLKAVQISMAAIESARTGKAIYLSEETA